MSSADHNYHTFELPYQNNVGFDAEMAHVKKSRSSCCFFGCCLGCLGLILLFLLCIASIYYCFFGGGATLIVSPETTVITEPLKSDGKTVDFHQAMKDRIEPNVQADENGFRDVLLGYGQGVFVTDEHWQHAAMCKELGIDPQTPPTFSLFRLTPENIQQWLAEVGKGLDAVQVAAAKPHYFIPMIRQNEKDLVAMSRPQAVHAFHERLSDALNTRAYVQFQSNDVAGAWKDILASLRLFRRVTINQAWEEALGGRDNESLFAPVVEVVASLPKWTPELLEQAITDLESLPDWQDRQTTLTMTQFMMLDLLSATNDPSDLHHRLQLPAEMRQMIAALQVIAFDWNLVAKELNGEIKSYGELLEQASGKSLVEQSELLGLGEEPLAIPFSGEQQWESFLEDRLMQDMSLNPLFASGRSKLTGEIASQLVKWAVGEMYRLQMVEESRCQALRLACALERFRREKGRYPESLAELGLKPMLTNVNFQYEKWGTGYHFQNRMFQLERE